MSKLAWREGEIGHCHPSSLIAGAIEARIEAALETHSVTGDKRPACLILDEVDGLATSSDGKSAVDFIVKLAEASRKGISQEEDGTAAEGRGHEESAERGRKRKSAKKVRERNET